MAWLGVHPSGWNTGPGSQNSWVLYPALGGECSPVVTAGDWEAGILGSLPCYELLSDHSSASFPLLSNSECPGFVGVDTRLNAPSWCAMRASDARRYLQSEKQIAGSTCRQWRVCGARGESVVGGEGSAAALATSVAIHCLGEERNHPCNAHTLVSGLLR